MTEYVYIFKAQDLYKIGYTTNVEKRLASYADSPVVVGFIFAAEVPDALKVESRLHRKYSDLRVRSEWFRLLPDDLEQVKVELSTIGSPYQSKRDVSFILGLPFKIRKESAPRSPLPAIEYNYDEEVETALSSLFGDNEESLLTGDSIRSTMADMVHRIQEDIKNQIPQYLKSSQEVAELYGVSRQSINARANRFKKRLNSFGWQVGKGVWVFTPEEVELLRPGNPGRPKGE